MRNAVACDRVDSRQGYRRFPVVASVRSARAQTRVAAAMPSWAVSVGLLIARHHAGRPRPAAPTADLFIVAVDDTTAATLAPEKSGQGP